MTSSVSHTKQHQLRSSGREHASTTDFVFKKFEPCSEQLSAPLSSVDRRALLAQDEILPRLQRPESARLCSTRDLHREIK